MKQFHQFLDEAHRLKTLYAPTITLLIGLETEFITNPDLDRLHDLLKKFGDRVEYVVGSVHHVNSVPIDFDIATYHKSLHSLNSTSEKELQEIFLCTYFDAQYELFLRFQPEIIGHLDLCRLYNPQLRISDYSLAWKKMERNIAYAVEYGGLFEVNASAFRKQWESPYPAKDVVEVKPSTTLHFVF
jgi:histidinol-phosphatase (PHP family)